MIWSSNRVALLWVKRKRYLWHGTFPPSSYFFPSSSAPACPARLSFSFSPVFFFLSFFFSLFSFLLLSSSLHVQLRWSDVININFLFFSFLFFPQVFFCWGMRCAVMRVRCRVNINLLFVVAHWVIHTYEFSCLVTGDWLNRGGGRMRCCEPQLVSVMSRLFPRW
ncbi:hypothetical protein BZA05DRAFT_73403 [Tricharina praecox]|uniref:uncharacterized protein n=1 Tax=Tricharina praecox TaxID=43433 RepID=UPI00221FF3F4|nr:uncharacterized protein BZA05DRAFT_73403 [Tricharina praecox]KAI5849689.1 hypothetical protein BZA05DRAFT_73403 [Tricharina praecox]